MDPGRNGCYRANNIVMRPQPPPLRLPREFSIALQEQPFVASACIRTAPFAAYWHHRQIWAGAGKSDMSAALDTHANNGTNVALRASLAGLSWLNFLVALMQTGFGAFLAVYLTTHGWSATAMGLALSVGTVAAMVSQVPAGLLVDWVPNKRVLVAGAILTVTGAALLIAGVPLALPVFTAQVLQGAAGSVLGPAIAALTLALSRQHMLGERLGRNVRFAAMGSAVAAGIMGAVGLWFSGQAMFLLAAASGPAAVLAVMMIRRADLEAAPARTTHRGALPRRARTEPPVPVRQVVLDPCLLAFAGCMALFQLGNAALLPLAASAITRAPGAVFQVVVSASDASWSPLVLTARLSELVVPASIILPQLLAAMLSPQLGRLAHHWARRPVLLLGVAVLPLRAVLLALDGAPELMVCYHALDGIAAAVIGVMIPLVVADITHAHGRFNLALGVVGLAASLGGAASTAIGGTLADHFGEATAFFCLAGVGVLACLAVMFLLPETHPEPKPLRQRRPA